jgi:hypothetical protein
MQRATYYFFFWYGPDGVSGLVRSGGSATT